MSALPRSMQEVNESIEKAPGSSRSWWYLVENGNVTAPSSARSPAVSLRVLRGFEVRWAGGLLPLSVNARTASWRFLL